MAEEVWAFSLMEGGSGEEVGAFSFFFLIFLCDGNEKGDEVFCCPR